MLAVNRSGIASGLVERFCMRVRWWFSWWFMLVVYVSCFMLPVLCLWFMLVILCWWFMLVVLC
ncbi:uncharacterized protein DS421_16g552300 [Arachis hypogaea]|nr:uncharacterized protein DS421_16g552300 [Arachis hypogaea]